MKNIITQIQNIFSGVWAAFKTVQFSDMAPFASVVACIFLLGSLISFSKKKIFKIAATIVLLLFLVGGAYWLIKVNKLSWESLIN